MTRTGGSSAWTSPQIIIAGLSLLMAAGGSFLALQRDDSDKIARRIERIEDRLNDHTSAIAVNRARLEYLERDRGEARGRRGE